MIVIDTKAFTDKLYALKVSLEADLTPFNANVHGILIAYFDAYDLGIDLPGHPGNLNIYTYINAGSAIDAFAERPCTWSTTAGWQTKAEMKERVLKCVEDALYLFEKVSKGEPIEE